jgi:hypothetical protein
MLSLCTTMRPSVRRSKHRRIPGTRWDVVGGGKRSSLQVVVYRPRVWVDGEGTKYLCAYGVITYIVTDGQDFARVYSQRVDGAPPKQAVGSTITTKYEMKDGASVQPRGVNASPP